MSLYDDVVTDFGQTTNNNEKSSSDIANWSNNSLKLLQYQVEAAKKRQQMSLNAAQALKRDKLSTKSSIAPVVDLSEKKRTQMQLMKNDANQTYTSPLSFLSKPLSPPSVHKNNTLAGKVFKKKYETFF
jgi:hypothetical protein